MDGRLLRCLDFGTAFFGRGGLAARDSRRCWRRIRKVPGRGRAGTPPRGAFARVLTLRARGARLSRAATCPAPCGRTPAHAAVPFRRPTDQVAVALPGEVDVGEVSRPPIRLPPRPADRRLACRCWILPPRTCGTAGSCWLSSRKVDSASTADRQPWHGDARCPAGCLRQPPLRSLLLE